MIRIYTKVYRVVCIDPSGIVCLSQVLCSQPKGQIPDYGAPVVLHDHSPSIEDFCLRLHKQLITQFKYAWVWGKSVRHQPQKVILNILVEKLEVRLKYWMYVQCGKDHLLEDEDVVQIIKKIQVGIEWTRSLYFSN